MNQGGADPVAHLRRFMSERMAEEEAAQRARDFRPLEDPYLVGEEAASRARRERLARESGDDILWDEDRRWNRFLGKSLAHSTEEAERERKGNGLTQFTQRKCKLGKTATAAPGEMCVRTNRSTSARS